MYPIYNIYPSIHISHLFLDILACSGHINAIRGDIESSHYALSIGGDIKAKYRSFVDRFNSVGVYFVLSSAESTPNFANLNKIEKNDLHHQQHYQQLDQH